MLLTVMCRDVFNIQARTFYEPPKEFVYSWCGNIWYLWSCYSCVSQVSNFSYGHVRESRVSKTHESDMLLTVMCRYSHDSNSDLINSHASHVDNGHISDRHDIDSLASESDVSDSQFSDTGMLVTLFSLN